MRSDVTALLVLLTALAAGCVRSVALPVVDRYPGPEGELDFWHALAAEPVLTNADALHGLLLLADGEDPATAWPARVAAARERGWIRGQGDLPPAESVLYGTVAVALCDVLDLGGGLTMRITGRLPRYCVRELEYEGLAPLRSTHQSISGLEFLDLVGRVEDRRREVDQAGVDG